MYAIYYENIKAGDKMKKVLIADDEARMRKLVGDFLKKDGYTVVEAADGNEAVDMFYDHGDFDLVILDVMMPKSDGWTVCRKIKKTSKVPVIMLTARGEESDELFGFELGADEYIKKPFSPKVLVARVNAIFKRNEPEEIINEGEIEINNSSRTVAINGNVIEIPPKEYELLLYLVRNKGIALNRDKILDNVWDMNFFGDERTVDTHIKRLRARIGEAGDHIQTVRGYGYKFEVKK